MARQATGCFKGFAPIAPRPPTESNSVVAWQDSSDSRSPTRSGVDFGPVAVSAAPAEMMLNGGKVVGATIDNTFQVVSARIRSTSAAGEAASADPRFVARLGSEDGLVVDLLWRSLADARSDGTVFAQLLDTSARLVAQNDGWPDHGYSPTSTWFPGDTIYDSIDVPVPADLPPGAYSIVLGMYRADTRTRLAIASGETTVSVGTIAVQ